MPASFVDQQVQFVAEVTALEEDLAGVGSSPADLQNYFDAHGAKFDTACISAAVYPSQSAAQDAAASVAFGTSFSTLVSNTASSGGGAQGCHPLPEWESSLPSDAGLGSLATGAVSSPISINNMYVLLQITSRTPTTYSNVKTDVANVVQEAGATATQKALAADERRSSVSVNPQYGVWVPVSASVLTPFTPAPSDVLNAAANEPAVPATAAAAVGNVGRGCLGCRFLGCGHGYVGRREHGCRDTGYRGHGSGDHGYREHGSGEHGYREHRSGEHGYRCSVLILGFGFVHPHQRLSVPRRRPHVVVVGLGPAGTDLLGIDATEQLTRAATEGRAYLRTARHPAAARFEGVPAFDHLYEAAATFDEVYAGIVEALVAAAIQAAPEPVVYAVPGSPSVAERTVDLLRADGRVEVTARPALSFLDLAWVALGIDPLAEGVRLVDASTSGSVVGREGGPFLVAQCWSRHLLSEVKLALPDDDGPELPRPVLLHHLGLDDEVVVGVDWWELDRTLEPDHLTSVYIPATVPADGRAAGDEVAQLVALMDTLRERCPWDSVQTHASLMPHLVEESYEVLDALAGLARGRDRRRRLRTPGGGAG